MLRHTTTQDGAPRRTDQQRHTHEPQERGEQQRVLDLQAGAGNRATVQTLHRTPLEEGSSETGVIRRAGDKLAFEGAAGLEEGGVQERARQAVADAIERHRKNKRDTSDFLENLKEEMVLFFDGAKQKRLDHLKVMWPEGGEVLAVLEGQVEESIINEHKTTLANYHDRVQNMTGWRWARLQNQIRLALYDACPGTPFVVSDRVGDEATVTVDGKVVYTVYFDDNRFVPDIPGDHRATFTKRGHQTTGPTGGPDPRKQFTKDANGVTTRRFVTRAFNVFHLATMFGINLDFSNVGGDPSGDKTLDTKRTLSQLKYRKKFDDLGRQHRTAGQMPRDPSGTFGGHTKVFNSTSAAAVGSVGKVGSAEFKANYPHAHNDAGPGRRTGFPLVTGRGGLRKPTDKLGTNEGGSMQVRNGSGNSQPFLSAASVQSKLEGRPQKVIRANKGERFDTGAENQGIVKIDLSQLPPEVNVVDQHSEPSHQHKIAWDRHCSKDDIRGLAARFVLAREIEGKTKALPTWINLEKVVAQIRPSQKEMVPFKDDQAAALAIMSGDVTALLKGYNKKDPSEKYTKRAAPQELDEYIYSARKNREVLFDKLPLTAVTEVFLSDDPGKWVNLNEEKVSRGKWHPLAEVKPELTAYLHGKGEYAAKVQVDEQYVEDDENFFHLRQMHEAAELGKLTEGHTRS